MRPERAPGARQYVIGVDVGTGSARAGVFDLAGQLLGSAKRPVEIWHEAGHVVEQSGDQIWLAVCASVQDAVADAGVTASEVVGVGFDATCSLVAVTADGSPVALGPSGDPRRNVMVWMDHRAAAEADEINAKGHAVLAYVGGRISPEMETPKLLWLKRNLPASFAAADHFFDLADYLTWRATGSTQRSVCTVTCKWTYLAHEKRWNRDYFDSIGLGELASEGFIRIGTEIVDPGSPLRNGLSVSASADLGLAAGTAVGAALIDAHAGGLGTLGGSVENTPADLECRLAYIFGTSACSVASADRPIFVSGVWGPYFSAMIPGLWLTEGGQSAAGAAIDHLVEMHPAAPAGHRAAESAGQSLVTWLDHQAVQHSARLSDAVMLAGQVHIVPEFLGNRSPFADPGARAIIAGLGLDTGLDDLVGLYVAGVCGIGYGLRQLLDTLGAHGIEIDTIVASGGAAQSELVLQLLADATDVPVAVAQTAQPVLLGAAMLGAAASGRLGSLTECMSAMSGQLRVVRPAGGMVREQHAGRYRAFGVLQAAGRAIRAGG